MTLVNEVPDVNPISLSNEDNSWPGWGESSTGVMSSDGGGGSEDRVFVSLAHLPDGEVEIMDGEEELRVEWRSLELKTVSVVPLRWVVLSDVLWLNFLLLSSLPFTAWWSDCPVNKADVSFVSRCVNKGAVTLVIEEETSDSHLSCSINSEQLDLEARLNHPVLDSQSLVSGHRSGIPEDDLSVL